jgi:hypothetical protein
MYSSMYDFFFINVCDPRPRMLHNMRIRMVDVHFKMVTLHEHFWEQKPETIYKSLSNFLNRS